MLTASQILTRNELLGLNVDRDAMMDECAIELAQTPLAAVAFPEPYGDHIPLVQEFEPVRNHVLPSMRHAYRKSESSILLYDGPSQLTGEPIFVIASWGSQNGKTGNMVQTTVLRSDMHPMDAIRSGGDEAMCGNCPHRGVLGKGRTCYVKLMFTFNMWKKYKRGDYDVYDGSGTLPWSRDLPIRFGTYGDPVAVPRKIWDTLLTWSTAEKHTGYTHQWNERPVLAEQYKDLCMASADNLIDRNLAKLAGWRTFRVLADQDAPQNGEIMCPSDKVQCAACGLCRGNRTKAKDISILVHGPSKRYFNEK